MLKRGILLAVVLPGLAFVGGAEPAYAAATGTLGSPGSGVLYQDCQDVKVPYSLSLPPGTDYWSVTVEALAPDGTHETSDFLYDDSDPATGAASLSFCGYEMPGTYTVVATGGEYSDYDSDVFDQPLTLNTTTFTMRLPQTKTTLSKKPAGKVTRLTVQVTDERPAGYFATDYAPVQLQVQNGSRWRNVPHTKETTDNGRYVYRIGRVGKMTKVRAVTRSSDAYTGSESRPVTLH